MSASTRKKRIAGKAQSAQFTTSDFCRHAALGKEVRHYIKADFKTQDGALVFGKDCFPQKAFEQMAITKKAFQNDCGGAAS